MIYRWNTKAAPTNRWMPLLLKSFYSLKHIIPKAHIVQTAYTWVAKGSGIILVQQIGGAEFDHAFDLWQAIINLAIQ